MQEQLCSFIYLFGDKMKKETENIYPRRKKHNKENNSLSEFFSFANFYTRREPVGTLVERDLLERKRM